MAGSERLTFDEVGRLPAPGDNVAIATRRIEAGTRVAHEGSEFTVPHTVLEGHRFAVERIGEGEDLLSWGLTFGQATKDIGPATTRATRRSCACCASATGPPKARLGRRPRRYPRPGRGQASGRVPQRGLDLPGEPNFRDAELEAYVLDEETFRPGSGSTVRRAAHLHGLPARRGPWRRDAQLRRRDGRHLAAHRVREGAGVGDERRRRRLRERERHSLRSPHRRRRGPHAEQPGPPAAHLERVHGQPQRGSGAFPRPRRPGGRHQRDAPLLPGE